MKLLAILLVLLLSNLAEANPKIGEYNMSGWLENYWQGNKKLHYHVKIQYIYKEPYFNVPGIISTEVRIGDNITRFPKESFALYALGWPTGFGEHGANGYSLYFENCGDGAKCFSLHYIIKNGILVERQLMPRGISELNDEAMIFNKNGKVIYNGPCNRQGKPIGKVKAEPGAAANP